MVELMGVLCLRHHDAEFNEKYNVFVSGMCDSWLLSAVNYKDGQKENRNHVVKIDKHERKRSERGESVVGVKQK